MSIEHRVRFSLLLFALAAALVLVPNCASADEPDLPSQAAAGLRKAVGFYLGKVSTEGGYLYRYSADLARREGERQADASTVWVQPPGTPSVGLAYLQAWQATGDAFYLDAAHRAGQALVHGQLLSGGWTYEIHFGPKARNGIAYRAAPTTPQGKNVTVLDDNTTQEALRLLMRLDRALVANGRTDSVVHESVLFALESLLKAQYPNGAWPQRYSAPPDAVQFPVKPAEYPESWSRTWTHPKYGSYYTFNDNALGDVIDVMLEAARLYDEPRYRTAAERGGDFILLSQMPDPQPAWAQQYDPQMHPAWARKFEPPSVTGGESQSNLLTLLNLYEATGQAKYLSSVPRALAYLEASQLPDGHLARFYELRTNKPLYFTRDYELTYSDADMPTHYGFKTGSNLDRIRKRYEKLKQLSPEQLGQPAKPRKPGPPSEEMIAKAKKALAALDDQGRWLEQGTLKTAPNPAGGDEPILRSDTFIANVKALCNYLAAASPALRSKESPAKAADKQ